jgi:hypothetical protein
MDCRSNRIVSTCIFPDRLKYPEAKPLHKKGSKQTISNYRPISLLTSFSKIVEKVMQSRLMSNLTKYYILSSEQVVLEKF